MTQITEVERPTDGYALLRFAGEREIVGKPGQFAMVRGKWGTNPILPRAFSLVETGKVGAVLVREVGAGTRLLVEMRPGDELSVLGPLGHGYSLPPEDARPVLVAGGVGVAPLVLMAEHLALAGAGLRPFFLYGARGSADLPLADRVAKSCDLTVTTEDGSSGERGLVTAPLERLLASDEKLAVYSCGPEPMLEAVARACVANGAFCQVSLESPMACGMGTCKGCAVLAASGDYKYVCSDGPVFESGEIYGGER